MTLIIGDNLYTTGALNTKRRDKAVKGGHKYSSETKARTQHMNNCITAKKKMSAM
jgi:hypothetical protein